MRRRAVGQEGDGVGEHRPDCIQGLRDRVGASRQHHNQAAPGDADELARQHGRRRAPQAR